MRTVVQVAAQLRKLGQRSRWVDSILHMLTDTIDCCGYIEVFEILAISYLCISMIKLNTVCMCMYIHIHRFDGARGVGGRQV